jgi:hypothetical protein
LPAGRAFSVHFSGKYFLLQSLEGGYILVRALGGRRFRESNREAKARGETIMNWKAKLILGVLTAGAMFLLTYALPRGNAVQNATLAMFPLTVGVWAIFVLLFVKLK